MDHITFQLSDEIFGGFQYDIAREVAVALSLDTIIEIVLDDLKDTLEAHDFARLIEIFNNKKWHIHGEVDFNEDVIYMCSYKEC